MLAVPQVKSQPQDKKTKRNHIYTFSSKEGAHLQNYKRQHRNENINKVETLNANGTEDRALSFCHVVHVTRQLSNHRCYSKQFFSCSNHLMHLKY